MLKPRRKPQKVYPNADRYAEDGRRLYSAYDGASVARRPTRRLWVKRLRVAAIVLAFGAGVLAAIVISALPH